MANGLFLCTKLTNHRRGHTLFVSAEAETFDTGAEAARPGPRCFWQDIPGVGVPMSGMKVRRLVVLCNHSAFHRRSAQITALLLLLDELMSCCAAGTNGSLDLRCRAFPPGQRVRVEWNGCPGSMARPARDSVAPLRRSCQQETSHLWPRTYMLQTAWKIVFIQTLLLKIKTKKLFRACLA